jgi:mediator of RNA polymerase II transcription subunit 31
VLVEVGIRAVRLGTWTLFADVAPSSPGYLAHLAATRVLFSPEMVAYLQYLLYWKQPEYARFLQWPFCLEFLDLLQEDDFRQKLLLNPDFAVALTRQFEFYWRFHRANLLLKRAEDEK